MTAALDSIIQGSLLALDTKLDGHPIKTLGSPNSVGETCCFN